MTAPIRIVPVGLRVDGKSILVVGAGRIAARKAAAYASQGAVLTVVAPVHGPEMAAVAVAQRIHRPFEPSDLDGAWLVVTATGIRSVDGAVFREAERRRVWCNAADDPANCSVILPAVVRRDDITVSISSGGRSPAAASWIRRRIERLLDDATSIVTDTCASVRDEVRSAGLGTEVDGWRTVLDDDALDLAASGRADELRTRLRDAVIGGRA